MRLYATVTSDRATKTQGGNKDITIKLQRDRNKLSHIIQYTEDTLRVSIITDDGGAIVYEETQPKDSIGLLTCHKCGKRFCGLRDKEDTCPICLQGYIHDQTKGEKEKGETCRWLTNGKNICISKSKKYGFCELHKPPFYA